ncbi:MAG: hypothetical protein JKP90_09925 [Desulfofustis sp. PB-SRB1]|nr:hypothetical protein [Desulfofustis sp. PB-SRB1]
MRELSSPNSRNMVIVLPYAGWNILGDYLQKSVDKKIANRLSSRASKAVRAGVNKAVTYGLFLD